VLFPRGPADLHLSTLQQFWNRNQVLLEVPPGSGEYYPEPAFSCTEAKRALVGKLPVSGRPPGTQVVRSTVQGLQPQLRQAVSFIRPKPQTVGEATRTVLEQERPISEPTPALNHATTSFNDTNHAVPGLKVHPPVASPPLDILGKLSVFQGSATSAGRTTVTTNTAAARQVSNTSTTTSQHGST